MRTYNPCVNDKYNATGGKIEVEIKVKVKNRLNLSINLNLLPGLNLNYLLSLPGLSPCSQTSQTYKT
jgi:hypothetical protein